MKHLNIEADFTESRRSHKNLFN